MLPRKGRFVESDLSALQIFHKCALLRCCYLTTGIRTRSPAGSALSFIDRLEQSMQFLPGCGSAKVMYAPAKPVPRLLRTVGIKSDQ